MTTVQHALTGDRDMCHESRTMNGNGLMRVVFAHTCALRGRADRYDNSTPTRNEIERRSTLDARSAEHPRQHRFRRIAKVTT
jgi:hypothetical protein